MTEEVKSDEAVNIEVVPLAGTSRADRAAVLVATIEHAMAHNAPLPAGTVKELRDLLDVPESPVSAEDVSSSAWSDEPADA
jgi:hypothetical protein